jgi:hypothetical protein
VADAPQDETAPEEDDEPIAALAALREAPTAQFVGRLRGTVERRRLVGGAAEVAWSGVGAVAREYLSLLFGALGGRPRGGTDERK